MPIDVEDRHQHQPHVRDQVGLPPLGDIAEEELQGIIAADLTRMDAGRDHDRRLARVGVPPSAGASAIRHEDNRNRIPLGRISAGGHLNVLRRRREFAQIGLRLGIGGAVGEVHRLDRHGAGVGGDGWGGRVRAICRRGTRGRPGTRQRHAQHEQESSVISSCHQPAAHCASLPRSLPLHTIGPPGRGGQALAAATTSPRTRAEAAHWCAPPGLRGSSALPGRAR